MPSSESLWPGLPGLDVVAGAAECSSWCAPSDAEVTTDAPEASSSCEESQSDAAVADPKVEAFEHVRSPSVVSCVDSDGEAVACPGASMITRDGCWCRELPDSGREHLGYDGTK